MKAFKNDNGLGGAQAPAAFMARAAAQAQAAPALAAFMARVAGQIPVLRTVKGALISSLVRVINSNRGLSDQPKAAQRWTVSRVHH